MFSMSSGETEVQPFSDFEAHAIVKAQEEAKERAKDEKETKLKNAIILETATADLGDKKLILNRVRSGNALRQAKTKIKYDKADFEEAAFFDVDTRNRFHLTLSGTVRGGITELWWQYEGHHFKAFSNANFLYLANLGGEYEDEESVYSVFPIIAEGNVRATSLNGEWRPTHADFNEGQIEYFLTKSSSDPVIDEEALKPIELMLQRYGKEYDQLKIAYENSQKLRSARAAYLKQNPPRKRNVIINSAPIDKTNR